MPGQLHDADEQCRFQYGPQSKQCRYGVSLHPFLGSIVKFLSILAPCAQSIHLALFRLKTRLMALLISQAYSVENAGQSMSDCRAGFGLKQW